MMRPVSRKAGLAALGDQLCVKLWMLSAGHMSFIPLQHPIKQPAISWQAIWTPPPSQTLLNATWLQCWWQPKWEVGPRWAKCNSLKSWMEHIEEGPEYSLGKKFLQLKSYWILNREIGTRTDRTQPKLSISFHAMRNDAEEGSVAEKTLAPETPHGR